MEGQDDWNAHAEFMDGMVEEGFVVLGGPLLGTEDVLLIVRAGEEAEVHARFAEDVWTQKGLLRTTWVAEWRLRLGELQ
jgi:uncharacterized protein YciI